MPTDKHAEQTADLPQPENLILIIVGAHLLAEMHDRPVAEQLRAVIDDHVQQAEDAFAPIVITDVWYLNNAELHHVPAISVGSPGVNAATALFARQLPTVLAIDGRYQIQLDAVGEDVRACLWGTDAEQLHLAVQAFISRHLAGLLAAAGVGGYSRI